MKKKVCLQVRFEYKKNVSTGHHPNLEPEYISKEPYSI